MRGVLSKNMSKETEIKARVFEKIRTGEASMHPRIYFVARVVFLATFSVVVLALTLFILSFALFSIHESGEQFLFGFGQGGIVAFIALFPWLPFLLTAVLILLLEYLLRYFKFGYRVSLLGIFLIALAIVGAAGVGITFTPLHGALLDSADRGELPIIGSLYEEIHDSHQAQGVYRGVISSIQGNEFMVVHDDNDKDTDDGTSTIVAPAGFAVATLRVGEHVYVAGTLVQGVVHAYGIQEFTANRK